MKRARPDQQWLNGKPTVWVLADYNCKALCGPVIGLVADALDKSGLCPGQDFRYLLSGSIPKIRPRMRQP